MWPERHLDRPAGRDIVIAACSLVIGQLVTWARLDSPSQFHGPRPLNAAIALVVSTSLLWRRRAPLAAVTTVVSVFCCTDAFVRHDIAPLSSFLPLIVLTASAGYHLPRRRALVAAGVAAAGLLVVVLAEPSLRSGSGFAYDLVFLLAPWVAARGLREREDRAAALGAQLERERAEQERVRRDVVAMERARIARELHDVVAHSVSIMVIQLGAARMSLLSGPEKVEEPLDAAEEVGRDALAELRRLLGVLRADAGSDPPDGSPAAPQPGLRLLPSLMSTARAAGLDATVATSGTPVPLSPGLDLTAYRIVQEALTNTLKHAHAQHFAVRLSYTMSVLEIDVVDDGPKAAVPTLRDAARRAGGDDAVGFGGHGLVGIRERVALFGGDASTGPAPGGGWRVHARLPLVGRRASVVGR